jgi:glycosyltransferase involved in cell wall biosynthesis
MKILLINTRYYPNHYGGAEQTVLEIAEELINLGNEVHVLSLAKGNEKELIKNGVKCHYYPINKTFWLQDTGKYWPIFRFFWYILDIYNPFIKSKLRRAIIDISPDIISTHNIKGFSPSLWDVIHNLKIPFIQMMHDYFLFCSNSTMYKKKRVCNHVCMRCQLFKLPIRFLSSMPDYYIANSEFTLSAARKAKVIGLMKKCSVIYPSCDLKNNEKYQLEFSEKEAVVFGFLGRIDQSKGVDFLLSAFTEITSPQTKLLIGGTGYPEYINKICNSYQDDRITFLGRVKPEEFFAKIDVLVVPSQWNEPFGRVIVEAFSRGIPVIASAMGGMTELVESGVTGELFEVTNKWQLVQHLQSFINKDKIPSSYSLQCIEKSRLYNVKKQASEFNCILQSIINNKADNIKIS